MNDRGDWLIGRKEIAAYCGIATRTLDRWRKRRRDPLKLHKPEGTQAVRIRRADLDAFLLSG